MPPCARGSAVPSPADDLALCRAIIRRHSRSFYVASRLLPAHVRDAAVATYAFCRAADDAVDEGSPTDARMRHAAVCRRLDCIYGGEPVDTASGRAFALVVAAAGIPREEP